MAWQVYSPFVSPWIDVRGIRGTPLISGYSSSYIKSTVSFIKSWRWFGNSSVWYSNSATTNMCYYAMPASVTEPTTGSGTNKYFYIGGATSALSATTDGSNFLTDHGFAFTSTTAFSYTRTWVRTYATTSYASKVCVLLPSRPLEKDPISTEQCNATVSTSLSGISYRTSYAHRRTWKISLLLDGPIDSSRPLFFQDPRPAALQNFLKKAENGVTIHLQGRNPQISTGYAIKTDSPYIGCPYSICGQLTGASWTLSGQDDKAMRYKLDLDIDQDPSTTYYV